MQRKRYEHDEEEVKGLIRSRFITCIKILKLIFFFNLQEVILHRTATDQKLGLTLCYGSLEDGTTDIFISEVCNQSYLPLKHSSLPQ